MWSGKTWPEKAMAATILILISSCLGAGPSVTDSGEKTASGEVTVSLNLVAAQQLEISQLLIDEELGAYRVDVSLRVSSSDGRNGQASYLLFTDAPGEAMQITVVGGETSFRFSDSALAFDMTGVSNEDVAAVLDLMRQDFAFAEAR